MPNSAKFTIWYLNDFNAGRKSHKTEINCLGLGGAAKQFQLRFYSKKTMRRTMVRNSRPAKLRAKLKNSEVVGEFCLVICR